MKEKLLSTWRLFFTLLVVVLGTIFLVQQRHELHTIIRIFGHSRFLYLALAAFATFGVVVAQGYVYRLSFSALNRDLPWHAAAVIYLKRFFLSPFLPGGFSVAQYTLSNELEPYHISVRENAVASALFLLSGSVSYFIVMIPALLLSGQSHSLPPSMVIAGLGLLGLLGLGGVVALLTLPKNDRSFVARRFPKIYQEVQTARGLITRPKLLIHVLLLCLSVDILNIASLWFSMQALHVQSTLAVATLGYVVSILVMTLSPFLQGIFLVEGALTVVLTQLGVQTDHAVASALLYRAYQLWIPFFIGGALLVVPTVRKWVHIYPAVITMAMGVVNVASALSMPLKRYIVYLEKYLPADIITYSRGFTFVSGFALFVIGFGLLHRSKTAWNLGVLLVCLSILTHITKGIDYPEALFGLITLEILLATRDIYIRSLRADFIR